MYLPKCIHLLYYIHHLKYIYLLFISFSFNSNMSTFLFLFRWSQTNIYSHWKENPLNTLFSFPSRPLSHTEFVWLQIKQLLHNQPPPNGKSFPAEGRDSAQSEKRCDLKKLYCTSKRCQDQGGEIDPGAHKINMCVAAGCSPAVS